MKQALRDRGLLARTALPPHVDALLSALVPDAPVASGPDVRGTAQLGVGGALGFLSFELRPPGPSVPYHLVSDEAAGSFRLWLVLNATDPAKKLFALAGGAAGAVLKPAVVKRDAKQEWLEETPGEVAITGLQVALLVEGKAGGAASVRLTPTDGEAEGLIHLALDPPAVLLGSSGFGLELTDGLWVDESASAGPPGATTIDGHPVTTPSDDDAWRGLAARKTRFFLPRALPFFGGHAVEAYVEVGSSPPGIDLAISTHWKPADDHGWGFDLLIECRDQAARGLQDFLPTLVEAAMTLPLEEATPKVGGQAFGVVAGKPVVARLRFARSSSDPLTHLTLGLESQGRDGILTVKAPEGGPAAKAFVVGGALATALAAESPPPGTDASGVPLVGLLALVLGIGTFLQDKGRLTLNTVELESAGDGLPLGGAITLKLDYSVEVSIKPIEVGALSVRMSDDHPMRVRNRNVRLTFDPDKSGLEAIRLDFSRADMEIEDPGGWIVHGPASLYGPASLFDVAGTRSGRGSTWLEVDLRFKLNLGPVKVSGATIRATRGDDGTFSASLRGVDASIAVPGAIEGGGKFQLLEGGGFAAELDASLVPLNLAVGASVLYAPHGDSFLLFLKIGIDLPGPIPIANTGLGIFGVGGAFGINARPAIPAATDGDEVGAQLKWDSSDPAVAFKFDADQLTIGGEAVIGTVPDLGFSLSAKAGIFLTIPDLAIRGVLWGKVLAPRLKVTDRPSTSEVGFAFKGVVVVDAADGVTVGLKGTLSVPVLIEAVVPLGAHFPFSRPGVDAADWFINLGADGYVNPARPDGRGSGPIRATVLPDLMPTEADAYLMQRGKGIDRWPRNQPGAISIADGFVLALGFGFESTIGIRPLVWADIHASLDVLLATRPLTLAGFGEVGGSLNLGPFSIGVDADLRFLVAENADPYIHARICGRIDLFFTDIEGCAEISLHSEPKHEVPLPDVHPLDDVENGAVVGDLAFLIDDRYRRVGALSRNEPPAAAGVWPDTLVHLSFAVSPTLDAGYAGGQFAGIDSYPSGLAAEPVGSDMLTYRWTLKGLQLLDVTGDPAGPGTPVGGPLSAAWQLGKDGDMGLRPQAGDLVLLTYQGDLWLNRLADGGVELPFNPMHELASLCEGETAPSLGWAVGFGAIPDRGRFLLPADPLSPDPTVSRFTATVTPGCSLLPVPIGPRTAAMLPAPYVYSPAAILTESEPLKLERSFLGEVDLGTVGAAPVREHAENFAEIEPSVPLEDARLLVLFDRSPFEDGPQVEVEDNTGTAWPPETTVLDDGRVVLRFARPDASEITKVLVSWPLGARVAVLGLAGTTLAARDAAKARDAARRAEAGRQAAAAATQPQQPTTTVGAGARCLLQPGRTYRLDVDMTWSGWLYEQQEGGPPKEVAKVLDRDRYRPKGGAETDTRRSLFFRTTPKQGAGPLAPLPKYATAFHLSTLHVKQDLFDPRMLVRHVAGYTPAQSERDRFRDDPLQVHFSASHAAALAKVYGYDLKIGLRRVDAAGPDGEEQTLDPLWLALTATEQLGLVDKLKLDVALGAQCPVPKPGATLEAQAPLAAEAWYELFTLVAGTGDLADGRLPGTTFRTSRWRTPAAMVAALGFTSPAGAAGGDVEVRALPPIAAAAGDDARFDAALDALGLDGWPAPAEPRHSVLWLERAAGGTSTWLCAGVLVESPEPVDRPGRCEVTRLTLQPPQPRSTFELRRSDRNRSRLLFLAPEPFVPPPSATAVLELLDRRSGATLSGAVAIPRQPRFSEDP